MHPQHPLQQAGHSPLPSTGVVRLIFSNSLSHRISASIRSNNTSLPVLRFLLSYSRPASSSPCSPYQRDSFQIPVIHSILALP